MKRIYTSSPVLQQISQGYIHTPYSSSVYMFILTDLAHTPLLSGSMLGHTKPPRAVVSAIRCLLQEQNSLLFVKIMVKHETLNLGVVGSNPTLGANMINIMSLIGRYVLVLLWTRPDSH